MDKSRTFDTIIFIKLLFLILVLEVWAGSCSPAALIRVRRWRNNRHVQNEGMRSLNECTKNEEAWAEWNRSKGIQGQRTEIQGKRCAGVHDSNRMKKANERM
jgi:hypothetical protein